VLRLRQDQGAIDQQRKVRDEDRPMTYSNPRSALNQYNQVGARSAEMETSPHRLVQMLLEGALDKIAIAKGHIERGNVGEKGRYVSWAISIVGGLRVSLDKSAGGEIAENLDRLYDYMEQRLLQANIESSVAKLDEVARLLLEIKSGWDRIAPAGKPAAEASRAEGAVEHLSIIG
jgi:flagellar protein FliS